MHNEEFDIICIGAGISGATLAERYASLGKKVLVLEKRDHIGGNCYDFVNDAGILISLYGPHFFHTEYEDVWQYVQKFAKWNPYKHKVLAQVGEKLVPVPVNIETVNILFNLHIKNEAEMKTWLEKNQVKVKNVKNSKNAAEARVGKKLFKLLFENYTKKQWGLSAAELAPEVLSRIPVRTNFEDRYFTDKYQALPVGGYTKLFEKMLSHPNITVRVNADYFDLKKKGSLPTFKKLFYTGPIDQFFAQTDSPVQTADKLQYRSLRFEYETLDQEYYQKNSVINFPGKGVPYTRIVEYKHLSNQENSKTTIVKEYGSDEGEPFYPVPNKKNQAIYEKYRAKSEKLKDIYFVGRLANYKYFNMDQAFKNALNLFNSLENTG